MASQSTALRDITSLLKQAQGVLARQRRTESKADAQRKARIAEAGREGGLQFWAVLTQVYQHDGYDAREIQILTGLSPFEQRQLVVAEGRRKAGDRTAYQSVKLASKGL